MILKEISLQTTDVDALYNFYKNIFQLETRKLDSKSISIHAGTTTLIFAQTNPSKNPFYHFAFNIPFNKIEEALQWLKRKVEVIWMEDYKNYIADFENWNARSVYFIDPAGNIVELIARRDLNDAIDESFSSSHIRNVSEIGIVLKATQFDARIDEMIRKYQLTYFLKQLPLNQFRAFGNDEGLFIVVPEHRNWYPTTIAGEIFPLHIIFENDGKEYRMQL